MKELVIDFIFHILRISLYLFMYKLVGFELVIILILNDIISYVTKGDNI